MRIWTAALLLLTLLASAAPVTADCTLTEAQMLADWTGDTPGQWYTRRALGVTVATWSGRPYLWLDAGNAVWIWEISAPERPRWAGRYQLACPSGCWAGLDGDNDHQLLHVSVCDDCRYGYAAFGVMGAAVFELGPGPDPRPGGHWVYAARQWTTGGLVWRDGDEHYLVASLDVACAGRAALYRIRSPTSLDLVECVQTGAAALLTVTGGIHLPGHLWLGDSAALVHIYRIDPGPHLTWLSSPLRASWAHGSGPGLDQVEHLVATASGWSSSGPNVVIWDVLDPAHPVQAAALTVPTVSHPLNRSSLGGGVLWVGAQASLEAATYDVSDPDHPRPLAAGWWPGPAHPRLQDYGAVISADETQLYRAGYSVLQRISIDCAAPAGAVFEDGFESGNTSAWSAE